MGSEKLTEAQRHALEWVGEKARRPWGKGRKGYPKMVSLEILVRKGLVEQEGWSCGQFSLTPAGRAALSPAGQGGRDE